MKAKKRAFQWFQIRAVLGMGLLLVTVLAQGQRSRHGTDRPPQNSENGWQLTPHGTIQVFVVFVEIDYDVNPDDDPQPKGSRGWKPGELPDYADDVFDAEVLGRPEGEITRYYDFCSLGNLRVLGDYWNETITVKESEAGRLNLTSIKRQVSNYLENFKSMHAAHGSSVADFDRWQSDARPGEKRVNESDDPHSFDHVMMFLRNYHGLRPNNGSASGGSFRTVNGFGSDSYSQFNGGNELPGRILRHEFNHMLIGGNNFHCCGGGSPAYTKLFIPGMYGWGLMGAANMSIPFCNAWDRYRLGWKQPGKKHLISALNKSGTLELEGDLSTDRLEQQGKYLLRDFATTGDAIRIRLPYIDSTKFQQYLWVENHQGSYKNGVEFDRFRHEDEEGYTALKPGLFMMVQVDKEEKEGKSIFGGYSNYLRPVLADGHFDVQWRSDSLKMKGRSWTARVHYKPQTFANPLTGSQDMEAISFNKDPSDSTLEVGDMVNPIIRVDRDGEPVYYPMFGYEGHSFNLDGNHKIGLGTNPSSANVLTYVSGKTVPRKENPHNNEVTHLNGISVEILEQRSDGAVLVEVRFDDTLIEEDVRWCSPKVLLHDIPKADIDLELAPKKQLLVDHGETPTRRSNPTMREGKQVFTIPTTLILGSDTKTILRRGSELLVDNCSQLVVEPGAELILEKGARIVARGGSEVLISSEAKITGKRRWIKEKGGTVVYE